jgi:trk system potassium uptake protein TrkH
MQIAYKNDTLERGLVGVKAGASLIIVASFALLFGFYEPPVPPRILVGILVVMLLVFVAGKIVRLLNAESRKEYLVANWYEMPLLLALGVVLVGAGHWFGQDEPSRVQHWAIALYLIIDVTIKFFTLFVRLAATGRDPTRIFIASFVVLIATGAILLMLPKATPGRACLPPVDAFFTATSATCVTGLTVRDTGREFTLMGQLVILTLIQLGGLGIVIFGAVLALLLGQALSVRESAALQDLLSEGTLGRINKMIVFVFVATALIELAGAAALLHMWNDAPGRNPGIHRQWYYSVFHAVSAFCNAGFGLFDDSLARYRRCAGTYLVIAPLIVLGGLGFGVLYDLGAVAWARVCWTCRRFLRRRGSLFVQAPRRMWLQTKVVLFVTAVLIPGGALLLFALERWTGQGPDARSFGVLDALFQSVSARTAGFNTVDIAALSDASKLVLILLMLIGGSPGGTAGGIKTVTLAVVVMAVVATLRRRDDVEVFRRSVRLVIVRRAVTVTVLFLTVLFGATLVLCVTEAAHHFTIMQTLFEVASALGTVGLSTGITSSLTTAGKLLMIAVMLTGRLGPLTLLAAVAFNLKPARYNYPEEAIVVG